jgi:hypothetical protein
MPSSSAARSWSVSLTSLALGPLLLALHDPLMRRSCAVAAFTKTAWYVIPLVWVPLAAWFARPYVLSQGVLPALSQLVIGFTFFTLVEYSVHRFVFHVDDMLPDSPTWRLLHFLLHGIHHKVRSNPRPPPPPRPRHPFLRHVSCRCRWIATASLCPLC